LAISACPAKPSGRRRAALREKTRNTEFSLNRRRRGKKMFYGLRGKKTKKINIPYQTGYFEPVSFRSSQKV
jgi:hypothetical protein